MMMASQFGMLNGMPTTQIAVRIDNQLLKSVDELVASGQMDSRADVVRNALAVLLYRREQDRIDQLTVEGYTRVPSTPSEDTAAEAAMILGMLEAKRGNDAEAVKALQQAEAGLPDNPLTSYYLGQTLMLAGRNADRCDSPGDGGVAEYVIR